jgi:hypothetical protein
MEQVALEGRGDTPGKPRRYTTRQRVLELRRKVNGKRVAKPRIQLNPPAGGASDYGRRGPGHNTSRMEEVLDSLCDLLRVGNSIPTACDLVGISPGTFSRWMHLGAEYEERVITGDQNPTDERYYLFLREVRKATAVYKNEMVQQLNEAGPGIWTKYLTILERKDRKGWGRGEDALAEQEVRYNEADQFL